MSNIVGGIYELREQIGAGGGGIVYLGWHINLKKPVVLKADKRSLKVGYDILRKEVDMLKNLSNSYIPQVYDFFEESGVVYTVIEYIDGKSFKDLLNMGQVFCQSDVIRWACQILNALIYLHNQKPYGILHGDIKPANIMLRDCGDICLIDYNIALALGEDGAVRVGYSRGYASPEHYGISYFEDFDTNVYDDTEIVNSDTVIVTGNRKITKYSNDKSKVSSGIRLDVRSDIYSLGATLYHLVSGNKPEVDATKVVRLDDTVCSPALASIISKAMHPVIGKRYQSADEMLQAFLDIYKNDKRSIRFRREKKIVFGALSIIALAGVISVAVGMKRQNILQQRLITVEYSKNALQEGDKKKGNKPCTFHIT
ncbi:kinase domain protein [Lachnospiraceae bacterium oral taxon 082 str. F0431]|nr:kinase domain protein [Lachnospiraceae bacterium oral taxon 082 str. F0431]